MSKAETKNLHIAGVADDAVKETVSEITSHKHESPKVERPKLIPLSDLEHAEIMQATQAVEMRRSHYQTCVTNILNGSLSDAVSLVASLQLAYKDIQLASQGADLVRAKHLASHACPNASYTPDLKALSVSPPAE
jgi:hypothetical protein